MNNLKSILNKIKAVIIYIAKYFVYLIKLVFWKIKSLFQRYPVYSIIGSVILIVLVIGGVLGIPLIQRYLATPRPLTLSKAPANSGYDYVARDSKNKFEGFIGDAKTNSPKIEVNFGTENKVDFVLTNLNQNLEKPTQSGNIVTFKNVRNNVDLSYQTLPKGIKESIVVKSPTPGNAFTFTVNAKGANPKLIAPQSYGPIFFDAQGKYVFHFEKPFAVDAKGARTDNVVLGIHKTEGENAYTATVIVNQKWLADSARVYPITIDPTITYNLSSQFAAGTFNRVLDTGSGSSPNLITYYQELPADQNTLGLWHLNEASGNVLDSSGNGLTGTPTGTTVTTGFLGNARNFNGTSDYITLTGEGGAFSRNIFTAEAWVNESTDNAANRFIIDDRDGANDGWLMDIASTDVFNCAYNAVSSTGSTVVVPGVWYHVACVSDGNSLQIYVNGILENSVTITGSISETADAIIGANINAAAFFPGIIDEVRVSSTARSAEGIRMDASRRPYSIYTSDVIDLGSDADHKPNAWNSISWTELGVGTGDGETLKDATSLVAQWNFNNATNTTTATNDAGSCSTTCNGTLTNMGTGSSGQDVLAGSGWTAANRRWGAGAVMFDGTNDFVSIPDDASWSFGSGDFAIELWVNSRDTNTQLGIFGQEGSTGYPANFFENITNQFRWVERAASGGNTIIVDFRSNKTIQPGQWYYVALTKSGSTYSMYINGKLDATATSATTTEDIAQVLDIGRRSSTTPEQFNGNIDSFRVYKGRALTASEILSNYNAGNTELQTRVGDSTDSNDGSWGAWVPTDTETQILSLDADSANWAWDTSSTVIPNTKSDDSTYKVEGTGSLKLTTGIPQTDANTVALWHLDETGGTSAYLKDSTSNHNDSTPTGTTVVNGIAGKARSFNGSSDFTEASDANSLDLATNGTIEAWIKTSTNKANNWFLCKTGNYCLGVNATGAFLYTGASAKNNAGTSLLSGVWHHVAVTNNNTTATYYIDGAAAGTSAVAWGSTLTGTLQFGRDGGTNYFSGSMDEIRISNSIRTAEEIAEDYRLGRDHYLNRTISSTDLSAKQKLAFNIAADRPGTYISATIGNSAFANYQPDANTLGLWHLDEQSGSGAYIKDASGNNRNGTPTGTTFTQGKIGKARSFDGASDGITITGEGAAFTSSSYTTSAWVKESTDTAANRMIIDNRDAANDGTLMNLGATDVFNCSYNATGLSSTTLALANVWYYVACTSNGSTLSIYVNGVLENSAAISGNISESTSAVIGARSFTSLATFFPGIIDEARYDNTARTADQIRQAYEVGLRTHLVTIDFAAKLDSGNLITNSSDTSFTVDGTYYGLNQKGSNLYPGDKIIVRENVNGTVSIAQGTVNGVNATTGAVTVSSWNTAPPSGGFSANADVFKWQREYWDISSILAGHKNATTLLSLRLTNGGEARTIWIDDLKSAGTYLSTPAGTAPTSATGKEYFQYRVIQSSSDYSVSPSVSSVILSYKNNLPEAPTSITPTALSSSSIEWTPVGATVGGGGDITGYYLYDGNGAQITSNVTCTASSCIETGLSINTQYTRKMAAFNSAVGHPAGVISGAVSAYTLADIPAIPLTGSPTATTVNVTPSAGTNPSGTALAIYVQTGATCTGSGGNYLKANGTSNGATAVWQTAGTWGTVTVTGLNLQANEYVFCVKARNGDNVETGFSAGESSNGGWFPLSGNYTVTKNMTYQNKYVDGNNPSRWVAGLDTDPNPQSTTNNSVLTLKSGTLTVLSNDTVSAGSFVFTGGSIFLPQDGSGQLKPGAPLWVVDHDADGYGATTKVYYGTAPTDGRRLNNMTTLASADCNDTNASITVPYARWIAAGQGTTNTLAYSNDGIVWTGLGTSIFGSAGKGVAWNGTRFVAGGQVTNSLAYSNDGIVWTGLGTGIFSTAGNGIAWNGTLFVAAGQGTTNTLAYSNDGIVWTGLGTGIFSIAGEGVAWNGTYFVAGGSGTANTLAYSADGIVWTGLGKTIFSSVGWNLTYNGTRFVAGGSGTANTLAYSADGIVWTGLGKTIFSSSGLSFAWNGTRFVAGGSGTNTLAYSADGIVWTGLGTSTFGDAGNGVAWNGTRFVAGGQTTNTLAYSSDGITWTGLGIGMFSSTGQGVASAPAPQLIPAQPSVCY